MDVTCTRCSTVYEFEESLISTTGTTVKCTQCGHLFKVHRPAAASDRPQPPGLDLHRELRWRVRRTDGSVHTLETLAELTRLAAAGQFTREDELSRTGQVWRKLGDIPELAALLDEPSPRPRRASEMPASPPPAAPGVETAAGAALTTETAVARPRPRTTSDRFPILNGGDGPLERTEVTRPPSERDAPLAPASPAPPQTPAPPPPRPVAAEDETRESDAITQPLPVMMREPGPRAPLPPPEPEEDTSPFEPRRSRLWPWLAVAVALAAAVGLSGAYLLRPAEPKAAVVTPPARAYLQRADEALDSHLPSRFDEAIAEYTKALAFHADDPHILSSISRVYAVWSDWLRMRLAFASAGGEASADELAASSSEARRLADEAKAYGERAAQRNPGNEEAGVALSDALRLTGNLVAARGELDRARATEGVASAETLRVAALLAIDEAGGDLRAGRTLAEQAVARDPAMIRARVLLARCLAADGDFEGARLHLAAAQRGGQPHPVLDEVRAALDRDEERARRPPSTAQRPAAKPAPRAATPPSAPPEPAATAEPAAEQAKAAAAAPEPAPQAPRRQAPAKRPADAGELASKGEAALERGAVQVAERLFGEALAAQPGLPRAKTGLGYVALERSQPRVALGHFKAAARAAYPEAFIGLGDAYRRLGRMREALSAYEEYMRRFPRGERRTIAQRQIELLGEQLREEP